MGYCNLCVNLVAHWLSSLLLNHACKPSTPAQLWYETSNPTDEGYGTNRLPVVNRQLQVEHRTGKVRRLKTDVLPLCRATNQPWQTWQRPTPYPLTN